MIIPLINKSDGKEKERVKQASAPMTSSRKINSRWRTANERENITEWLSVANVSSEHIEALSVAKEDEVGGYCGSPLHAAAFNGHVEALNLLLNHGADVNLTAGYFGSALQNASYSGHSEIVHLLLDHGADVNLSSGCYGSALQAAAAAGRKEEVELLLEFGADVNLLGIMAVHYKQLRQLGIKKRWNYS